LFILTYFLFDDRFEQRRAEKLKLVRLYMEVRDFDSARSHLAAFISENVADAQAWRLMAELAESGERKDWKKAAEYYAE
jgi:Tfp pilus assembly protein PilF